MSAISRHRRRYTPRRPKADVVEGAASPQDRLDALRRAVGFMTIPATDDPEHPVVRRQIELASEVLRAEERSKAGSAERLSAMEVDLAERGLLERALREARRIESMRMRWKDPSWGRS